MCQEISFFWSILNQTVKCKTVRGKQPCAHWIRGACWEGALTYVDPLEGACEVSAYRMYVFVSVCLCEWCLVERSTDA